VRGPGRHLERSAGSNPRGLAQFMPSGRLCEAGMDRPWLPLSAAPGRKLVRVGGTLAGLGDFLLRRQERLYRERLGQGRIVEEAKPEECMDCPPVVDAPQCDDHDDDERKGEPLTRPIRARETGGTSAL
jgi:hypothetical protein